MPLVPRHVDFDPVADIAEFHRKFGLEYVGHPRFLPEDIRQFRFDFMSEELTEYDNSGNDLEQQFDALIDLVYVALGTAHLHGFDFREGWRRVHEANMRKVRCERPGDSLRGSTWDVIKPPGWTAPSLKDLCHDERAGDAGNQDFA